MPPSSADFTPDMSVRVGPLRLATPLVMASGTWGYGLEVADLVDHARIGAISLKGTTMEPRRGNPAPRFREAPSALLNSVGLENVGLRELIATKLPAVAGLPTLRFVNITGTSIEEYGEMAAMLSDVAEADAIEANVSCPNVKAGGRSFGASAESTAAVVRAVRRGAPGKPCIVKLAPSVTDIVEIARAAVDAGADALGIGNSFLGLSIDVERRAFVFANKVSGYSGPAIKPMMLRLVWQVATAMPGVPIIGTGGVMTGSDAIEYLLAGASAVGIGTASLVEPTAANRILDEMESYCVRHGIASVSGLVAQLAR